MPTRDVHTKLRKAIRLIDAATDGVRQAIPRREDYQNDDTFQEARGKIHLLLGMLCEVRGDLQDRAGDETSPTETSASVSIWRPMADAPTDAPFLAKFRDDWTIPVDGQPQLSCWAGRQVVARMRNGDVMLDAPTDGRWFFVPDEIEGWAPLHGERAQ